MEFDQILKTIYDLALFYKMSKPYIVGGIPRDVYMDKEIKTTDIDITTNSPDSLRLGILVADKLDIPFKLYDDGHLTAFSEKFDLDFSSNFISKGAIEHISAEKKNIIEAYSRDFTINTIHQDLITKKLYDPTDLAFEDVKNKIIRTPIPADITLLDDPRRAFRAIELAIRYDFDIDKDIITFAKNNIEIFSSEDVKDKYVASKINKSMKKNPEKTIALLKEFGLFSLVPLVGDFKEYLIRNKILAEYLG